MPGGGPGLSILPGNTDYFSLSQGDLFSLTQT